jgi:hypothetical protein
MRVTLTSPPSVSRLDRTVVLNLSCSRTPGCNFVPFLYPRLKTGIENVGASTSHSPMGFHGLNQTDCCELGAVDRMDGNVNEDELLIGGNHLGCVIPCRLMEVSRRFKGTWLPSSGLKSKVSKKPVLSCEPALSLSHTHTDDFLY